MKTLYMLLIVLLTSISIGQTKQLSTEEVSAIYTKEKRVNLDIDYPIFRVYEYSDKEGKHHLVLAEKINQKSAADPAAIQGFHFLIKDGKHTLVWKMQDAKLKENEVSEEFGMWFWTKYFDIKDIDGDGLVDPILIYGTKGNNGFDDGRIKILIYYKGKKIGIRHQNSTLDGERNTKVDGTFYQLDAKIQKHVHDIMVMISNKQHAIWPAGWEQAMKNGKTTFDEN